MYLVIWILKGDNWDITIKLYILMVVQNNSYLIFNVKDGLNYDFVIRQQWSNYMYCQFNIKTKYNCTMNVLGKP